MLWQVSSAAMETRMTGKRTGGPAFSPTSSLLLLEAGLVGPGLNQHHCGTQRLKPVLEWDGSKIQAVVCHRHS